jgi:hypothetical protein
MFLHPRESALMTRLFFALLLLIGLSLDAAAQSLPSPSTWKNQRGSFLYVSFIDSGGNFRGQFINNASNFQCKGTSYDTAGRAAGPVVFFVVTFAPCNTVTRWRGRWTGQTIKTTWDLTYVDQNGQVRTMKGSDDFQQVQ